MAKRMGKKRIIAETGAGQHGVATATAAALFGLQCRVYMGTEDIERQALNVFRMEMLGAEVEPAACGTGTLKDATNEALRHWAARVEDTYYVLGSVVGPHPYPEIVRDLQRVIGDELREQIMEQEGRLPTTSSPVWEAAATPWGYSTPSLRIRRLKWSVWRPGARASISATQRH